MVYSITFIIYDQSTLLYDSFSRKGYKNKIHVISVLYLHLFCTESLTHRNAMSANTTYLNTHTVISNDVFKSHVKAVIIILMKL